MTDEMDGNSQKDEVDALLICYISHPSRTKLLFYRHYNAILKID